MVKCPVCQGTKASWFDFGAGVEFGPCPDCDGTGEVLEVAEEPTYGDAVTQAEQVAAVAWFASKPCHDCGGSGQVRIYRSGRLNDYVLGICNSCRERIAA
jgi:DnaJ-class molecular chaperone